MKKVIICIAIFLISYSKNNSQTFSINISPDTLTVQMGQIANYSLTGVPYSGFSASIFLSLQNFQTSAVTISPSILNPPYNNCNISVSSSNLPPGDYQLIIKGQQSSIVSMDTVVLRVQFNPNLTWFQFKKETSGVACNDAYPICVDKSNNIWASSICSSNSGLYMYDHSYWYQWTSNKYNVTNFWGSITSQQNNSMLSLSSGKVNDIAIDSSGTKWMATENGLIRFDGSTYTFSFTTDIITSVTAYNNKVCIGVLGAGFKYYDGYNWHSFNTSNSNLPSNLVGNIRMENDSDLWIGTNGGGLAHYDFNFWTIYNTTNSILPNNNIFALEIDKWNNKWLSTAGSGLIKYNNVSWQQFNPPGAEIGAICADHVGDIWLGFISGNPNNALVRFNGSNFQTYNSSNSGFKSDITTPAYGKISSIREDKNYTLWISTPGDGIFAFNSTGLLTTFPLQFASVKEEKNNSIIIKIYPNPTSANLHLELEQNNYPNSKLEIINSIGQTVLKTEFKNQIDVSELATGFYTLLLKDDSEGVITKKFVKE